MSGQTLDESEDIEVLLMKPREVYEMIERNEMLQALMAAPLWRYFATHSIPAPIVRDVSSIELGGIPALPDIPGFPGHPEFPG